jgi:hypothetical protein
LQRHCFLSALYPAQIVGGEHHNLAYGVDLNYRPSDVNIATFARCLRN